MVRVRLTPGDASAGGTRIFHVLRAEFNVQSRQLVLVLRDGKICVELVGLWEMSSEWADGAVPHTIAEAERIHDGRSLVLLSH